MADTKRPPPVWESFPQDLLSVPVLSKEYDYLNDEKVLRDLGQEVRQSFLSNVKKSDNFDLEKGVILLQGGTSQLANYYDTDTLIAPFRQESFFQYLFRLCEPDCYGAIFLKTGESVLFVPKLPKEVSRWNGPPHSLQHYAKKYGVSRARHVEDMMKEMVDQKVEKVYTLKGVNTDSGMVTSLQPNVSLIAKEQKCGDKLKQDATTLYPVLAESRVIKTEKEIAYMRSACLVTSQAHVFVMRHLKPGMSELQLETMFKAFCGMYGGARHMAYTCICASGPHGSILHYGHAGRPNDRILRESDLLVLDMGAEFQGYATDITSSYPVSGKFTKEQSAVHSAVREAQEAVMSRLKPGVSWLEMHRVAERVILTHLLRMGVLKGASVETLMEHHMGAVFMPHGLGHFIGMDVHDVNGYPESGPAKNGQLGVRWLRTQRVLEQNMVLTVEPGLYFNDLWIEEMLQADEKKSAFVDRDVLKKYLGMGGVRLEDDVLVTADGCENFTKLPKTINEYEAVIGKYNPRCLTCKE